MSNRRLSDIERQAEARRTADEYIVIALRDQGRQRTADERRAHKFRLQGGICYWFTEAKRLGVASHCPDPLGRMTLERTPSGKVGPNFATFEHLVRRRDGGAGLPFNTVLACSRCNARREHGYRPPFQPRRPENVAAELVPDASLIEKAKAGALNDPERRQLYVRGSCASTTRSGRTEGGSFFGRPWLK